MVATIIVIILIVLWLAGVFGPPVIPEITLPTITIAWSDPLIQAFIIVVVIVIIAALIRR
jgi:hypothetical protein